MEIMEVVKKGLTETSKLMKVVLIFFVFNVIMGIISLPLNNPLNADDPGIALLSGILTLVFFLGFVFLQGGALGIVKDRIKTGAGELSQFAAYGKKFYLRILGLLLMYVLIAVAVVLLLALLSAGLLLLGDNIFVRSIIAVIITVVAFIMITLLIYPVYAIVVDDVGPVMALRNGINASKDNFKKTLGAFVVLLVASLLISLVIGFLTGIATMPFGDLVSRVILAIVNAAVQSYIPVVMMVAFMSLYMSLKTGAAQPQAPETSGTIEG